MVHRFVPAQIIAISSAKVTRGIPVKLVKSDTTQQVSTAFKEVNAQWGSWASSQRGGARTNGEV